jgi:hypothetical protein
VDSLALAVLDHAERLEEALGPCSAWRVTGGGTRNRLLDIHLIDVIAACGVSAAEARTVSVSSRFAPWTELRLEREPAGHHVHDRTRPSDEQ